MGAVASVCGAICCCANCFCTTNVMASKGVRLMYALIFLITSIAAWVTKSGNIEDRLEDSSEPFDIDCTGGADCFSTIAVHRVMLGLVFFHAGLMVLTLGAKSRAGFQGVVHNGLWAVKLCTWVTVVVCCWFVNARRFIAFFWAAFVGSTIFLFVNLVLLIDFAHSWAEVWRGRFVSGRSSWIVGMGVASLLMYTGIIALVALEYVYFAPSGCGLNVAFITINLLLVLFSTMLSLSKTVQDKNPNSGILQPGVVGLFSTQLVWSALANVPESEGCNEFDTIERSQNVSMFFAVFLLFLAISWGVLRSGKEEEREKKKKKTKKQKQKEKQKEKEKKKKNIQEEQHPGTHPCTCPYQMHCP
eukprot:m.98453 g.98453  ORF g.98453 m.98453 type:complete len:359 (-) comp15276_c0_seq3:568-1644(-)